MTTASEIYRTANLLIETYGEMAVVGAALKADSCQRSGDNTGRAVWLRVARAVESIMDDECVPPGATIN
jgi:hypothetical protein